MRATCITLQLVPVPGVGAMVAGAKNPHTKLLSHGIAQTALVVFGSWPLIIPGAAGLAWAAWDAYVIGRDTRMPPRWSHPTQDADPETVDRRKEAKMAARAARRAEKAAMKAEKRAEREARDAARLLEQED